MQAREVEYMDPYGYVDTKGNTKRTPLSVKVNRTKKCHRANCNNNRGDHGLYCTAECHRIDNN